MFILLNPNLVQSDEGFSVETVGRTGIRYIQYGKTLFVDSEYMAGPNLEILVFARGVKNRDFGDNIEEDERKKIAENILRALSFRGLKVKLRW